MHVKCRDARLSRFSSMFIRRSKAARSELWFRWNFTSRWRIPRRTFWRHNVHCLLRYIGMPLFSPPSVTLWNWNGAHWLYQVIVLIQINFTQSIYKRGRTNVLSTSSTTIVIMSPFPPIGFWIRYSLANILKKCVRCYHQIYQSSPQLRRRYFKRKWISSG